MEKYEILEIHCGQGRLPAFLFKFHTGERSLCESF